MLFTVTNRESPAKLPDDFDPTTSSEDQVELTEDQVSKAHDAAHRALTQDGADRLAVTLTSTDDARQVLVLLVPVPGAEDDDGYHSMLSEGTEVDVNLAVDGDTIT